MRAILPGVCVPLSILRRVAARLAVGLVLVGALASTAGAQPTPADVVPPPALHFEAPPRLEEQARALAALDREPLHRLMALVGLEHPGPPVRIVLAPEGSPASRRAPSWAVAYAVGAAGVVVLMPSRVPTYPDRNLEETLWHELSHVLLARAAGRRGVPRWFDEGVALYASRDTRTADHLYLVVAAVRRDVLALDRLDVRFHRGQRPAAQAYALSGAFVRFVVERHGEPVVAAILREVRGGASFPLAFERATGHSLADAERAFWRDVGLWHRWVPLLTSSSFGWLLVSLLALWAFKRRRERDEELRERWEAEEAWMAEAEADANPGPTQWIH